MNPRFLQPLSQDNYTKHFFNAVRFKRQQDLAQRKLSHSWAANGHKLYPSSIKSLTMCPHRFIQEDVHKAPSFTVPVTYSLELGKYVHTMLQTEGLGVEGLYWEEPDYSGYEDYGLFQELVEKRKLIHPEVPVVDPLSGISGRADAILNINGRPVVFDIKTTSVEDLKLDTSGTFVVEKDRWMTKCNKELPSEEHKIQVGIYCHLINKFKLFSQPVRRAGLGYINLLFKPGTPEAEFEVYFDFDEEFEKDIALLVEHLGIQRQQYLDGVEGSCEYPRCRVHNLKRTLDRAKLEGTGE